MSKAFTEQLRKWRENRGWNQQQMAEFTGIGYRTYQTIEAYGVIKKMSYATTIKDKTGIDYTQIFAPKSAQVEPNGVTEESGQYQKARLELKNKNDRKPVPVVGSYTSLGNLTVYNDEGMEGKVVDYLPATLFPGCNYAERAKGDSMYPLIMNQALLVGKTCTVKGIIYGEKYIIKTQDGLDTTKYIHPGSKENRIKLVAYNKSVPEQEIDVRDISFVCRVQWIINPT